MTRTLFNVGTGFDIAQLHAQHKPHLTEWPWTDNGRLTWDRFDPATLFNIYFEAAVLAEIDGLAPVLRGAQDVGFTSLSILRNAAATFNGDFKGRRRPTFTPFIDTAALGDVISTAGERVAFDFNVDAHLERIWTGMLRPFFKVFDDSSDRLRLERTSSGRVLVTWWSISPGVISQGMLHGESAQRLLDHISRRMTEDGYGPVDHIVDKSWPADINAYGMHAWFQPPQSAYSTQSHKGVVTGVAVPGFRNYSDGQRHIPRKDGETLRTALAACRLAKCDYVFLESLTNIEESAGFYRSDAWTPNTLYLDIVREHIQATRPPAPPKRIAIFAVHVVTDTETKKPIPDAGILINHGGEGRTNADGYFAFKNIPHGPLSFSVHKTGYKDYISEALNLSGNLQVEVVPERLTTGRPGLVRADRKALRDDVGLFHPLGCTFFWALQGTRAEKDRVLAHLDYLATYKLDYLRILGEVDWKERHIDPHWPDYEQVLGEFMDLAYARGMRTQVTLIGGKQGDALWPIVVDKVARVVNNGRRHLLFAAEIANEWDRLDKITFGNLEKAGKALRALLPEHLIAFSRPKPKVGEHDDSGFGAIRDAAHRVGANFFVQHPRRSRSEFGWDHVSQAYDFKEFEFASSNNEPEGPQSSVVSEMRPLFLAINAALTRVCNGACYVFHPGQMVTGQVDPTHGRPANLWDVPNIDACLKAVRGVDALLPDGVENWHVVNNFRDDHPLPLQKPDFWPSYNTGTVNKNYAALSGQEFVVVLCGVKAPEDGERVLIGRALKACHVEAFDPVSGKLQEPRDLAKGEPWLLPGMQNTEAGYIVRGTFR